jgi:hypothetical protein
LLRNDWTELGSTWNVRDGIQAWTTPGGDFVADAADLTTLNTSSTELVFSSLAAIASDAVALRGGQLDLLLMGDELPQNNFVGLNSCDNANVASHPQLIINYLAAPQLSILDHGDGSGATATVGSADPAATTVVHVRGFAGDLGDGAWNAVGTVSGSGDLELDLPAGHYFAYAVSSIGSAQVASRVVYFTISDGLESIHTRCLNAVQARIRLLGLEGITNAQIVIEKVPAGRNLAAGAGLPAIVLSPQRTAMPTAAGTNGADDVHYDILVAIFDRDNQEPTLELNLDRHLLWRQQIAKAFRNQRLPGVPEVITSEVEPAEGLIDEAWKRELMVSALRLRFTSRETRGF